MSDPDKNTVVLAVSGGIDSVVMLDVLSKQPGRYIVAHVDHGIRIDSMDDERFVCELAQGYGLPYASTRLKLPSTVSEETARTARYAWLEGVRSAHNAEAIATAHHADDVLETMSINLLRGTGWRGICSLRDIPSRRRPMLSWSKVDIVAYAIEHGLDWREDSTNDSVRYLRNRVRSQLIPLLTNEQREQLLALNNEQLYLREQIETETGTLIDHFTSDNELSRYALIMMESRCAIELLREWLGEPLQRHRYHELLLFAKTARVGAKWHVDGVRFVTAKKSGIIVQLSRD